MIKTMSVAISCYRFHEQFSPIGYDFDGLDCVLFKGFLVLSKTC